MPSVTIVGVGRVGASFALRFRNSEYTIRNLIGTHKGEPFADVVRFDDVTELCDELILLTLPDRDISAIASQIAPKIKNKPVVLHTSGSLSSEILKPLADIGCPVGSMHPLISFTDPELGAKALTGAYFCVEGDMKAVASARNLVNFFGGQAFEVDTANKVLYHTAAVTACGHLTALIDVAQTMLRKAGVDKEITSKILLPLVKSTVNNIESLGTAAALTGTFARADVDGFKRQLEAFDGKLSLNQIEIFLSLASRSIEIASDNGAEPTDISRMAELITLAKTELR